MDAQSQITKSGQYSRVCNSCRRQLNLCSFGELWNGREGFNSTCKTCRKQSQKKHFAKTYLRKQPLRAKPSTFIASLDEHNRAVLSNTIPLQGAANLDGISTLRGTPCRALIEMESQKARRYLRLQLFVQDDERPFTVESGTLDIESFIRCCLLILRQQSVRLLVPGITSRSEMIFLSELHPAQ